jgi:hypothetical protein
MPMNSQPSRFPAEDGHAASVLRDPAAPGQGTPPRPASGVADRRRRTWPRSVGGTLLPLLLASCARPWLDPVVVAQDRSGHAAQAMGVPRASAGAGYYAGTWTPSPGGSCAGAAPVARDMLVKGWFAASGVNDPLRGVVQPDGAASLAYGKALLTGRFDGDGFAGHADTGNGCGWRVTLARQAPIGLPPGTVLAPGADVVQGEVPEAPAREAGPPPGAAVER